MTWFTHIAHLMDQRNERYLPTAFDGSLSLVEKLNKAIEYLNNVIDTTNTIGDYVDTNVNQQNLNIKNLRDEFEALLYWVENEGLEERTAQVLSEWFDSGKLALVINNNVLGMKATKGEIVSSDLSTATDAGKIQLINLSQEVQAVMAGTSPVLATVADGSVTSEKYAIESIIASKLAKSYRNRPNIVSGINISTATKDGVYLVLSGALGLPTDFTANSSGILTVDSIADRWIIQTLYELNNIKKRWVRIYDTTSTAPVFIKDFPVGFGSILGENIADLAIERKHLKDNYNYKGIIPYADVDTTYKTGAYLITEVNEYTNSSAILIVEQTTSRFVVQQLFPLTSAISKTPFYRVVDTSNAVENHPSFTPLSDDYKGVLSTTDLNTVIEQGTYLVTGGTNTPLNTNQGTLVVKKLNTAWISQVLYPLNSEGSTMPSYRSWRSPIQEPTKWNQFMSIESLSGVSLSGQEVVNFGDSIFGNKRPPNDVSTAIANKTGATVHNLGFGGCQMSQHRTWWDAFSMYRLADAIATGDFSLQDQALADGISPTDPNLYSDRLPSYFTETVNLMKSIDFTKVNYVTIGYGTNDWTDGVAIDGAGNKDTTTYKGALRYSLERLMVAFPNLKVMLLTPTYRFWLDQSTMEIVEDSDDKLINGVTLIPFVEAIEDVAKEYKVPYVDNYFDLGINKFNRNLYFSGVDGTHHNVEGGRFLGNKIGSQLISRF